MSHSLMRKAKGRRFSLSRRKLESYCWAYFMIFPTVLGISVFYLWPLLQSFYLAFTSWGAFGTYEWGGLANFERMISDRNLILALRNTVVFTALSVPFGIAVATLVAVLLNSRIRGVSFYRMIYFLPVVTMPVAVAIVWRWLYNADYGLINYALQSWFGIQGPRWLTDPNIALYSLIIVAIWSSIGTNMILILSGLQGISSVYYEAADIDGASPVIKLFQITLPLLSPTIFFVSVTALISAFQVFELILLMIGQNSMAIRATQTIVFLFYREGFVYMNRGYASAIALVLFVIILSVTVIQLRLQKRWVHYG